LSDVSFIVVQKNLAAAEPEHFVRSDTLEADVENAINNLGYGVNSAGSKGSEY
jgi:hypothetical protein